MDIERERGISVTSAALEFELDGYRITILDTPGHQDFSEDTYRTLFAVDSAVMVIDAAKGIEAQTRKLFDVCRLRRLPVLTFINKLDLPSRDPLDLLHELETVLGIHAVPMNWPIGSGDRFRGVYDLAERTARVYERQVGGIHRAPVTTASAADPLLGEIIGEAAQADLVESLALLEGAGSPFDRDAYLAFAQTPVFFGSALSNFGLEPLLDGLKRLAPCPGPRAADGGVVSPAAPDFSGFVFKIQANMNPRHRDRVAFVRVCSGVFTKDMQLVNARLGTPLRASRAYRFFGGKRETIDRAMPGDVVGLVNPGQFAIGDSLYAGTRVVFPPMPRFPAEHFGIARLRDSRLKQFDAGIRQLEEEGMMQVAYPLHGRREPVLAVVGPLQLEIVEARLRQEYNVDCGVEPINYTLMRWLSGEAQAIDSLQLVNGVMRVADRHGRPVALFESQWHLDYCKKLNPGVEFQALG
jgi:peptide chain release factor 3